MNTSAHIFITPKSAPLYRGKLCNCALSILQYCNRPSWTHIIQILHLHQSHWHSTFFVTWLNKNTDLKVKLFFASFFAVAGYNFVINDQLINSLNYFHYSRTTYMLSSFLRFTGYSSTFSALIYLARLLEGSRVMETNKKRNWKQIVPKS